MVSVCLATYNGEKYIRAQLESISRQLADDDEIIVSDDSSTDNTVKIILSMNLKNLKLIENCKFKSPLRNFENAINNACGDIILLSDQDDIWLDNKVTIMTKVLKENILVLSDCEVVDENLDIINQSFFKVNKSTPGLIQNILKNSFIGCCMGFKRELLKYTLPFPKGLAMHDYWLGCSAYLYGKVTFIDNKLIKYRRHKGNASTTAKKSNINLLKKIITRIHLITNLIKYSIYSDLKRDRKI